MGKNGLFFYNSTKITMVIKRILGLAFSIAKHGFTLLALLDSVKKTTIKEASLQDDGVKLSYPDLYAQSLAMASHLQTKYKIKTGSNIVIVSTNSVAFVTSLFSVSSIGTNIFLLNPNQKEDYYTFFFANNPINLIIGANPNDYNFSNKQIPFFSYHEKIAPQDPLIRTKSQKWKKSSLVILSSGSKGKPTNEKRKLGVLKYWNPLIDIVEKLALKENKSVLISVPIFHGYGLAALFLSVFMGQKTYLTPKFDSKKTLELLKNNDINSWIAVPLMIQKVFSLPAMQTTALQKIISGGDVLPSSIVEAIHKQGSIQIYNLYGTSETGVCTIATNKDLRRYPQTIGTAIRGVKTKITNQKGSVIPNDAVGELHIKCAWSADTKKDHFEPTGDLVSKNSEGYYFHKGRKDDLIIIGGENIYPIELEQILYRNPKIKWVKAKAMITEIGTFIIHIDLVVDDTVGFCEHEYKDWIATAVPKYMIPKSMRFLKTEPVPKLM
jgi:acyl-CoA synthetase (AMP-forming)/AMP-acid ligase II